MAAILHERWFVSDEGLVVLWSAVSEARTLVAFGTAAVVTAAVGVAWRVVGRRPLIPGPLALGATREQLAVVYGWIPLMLAVHTAIPLLVAGVRHQLLVPNLEMGIATATLLGLSEVAVALLLFYGVFARYAALGLGAIWLAGAAIFGPVLLLEHTFYLGIAAFFWIAGRGPISIDRIFGHWAHARERWLSHGVPILRVSIGFSVAWLALTEKLLNLPLALAFVDEFPFVNFLPAIGIEMSDSTFIQLAGTVELTAGLLLVLGAFPRIVILLLWLPFNLTLTAFGWQELVGHLPIYAIMALILLWGPGGHEDERAFHAGLIPTRGKPIERERLEEERGDRLV